MKKRIFIVLLTMIGIIVFLCFIPETYQLTVNKEMKKGITIEYGETIHVDLHDFLFFSKKFKNSKEKIISQTYIKVETIKGNLVSFQKPLPIGKYQIVLLYKEQKRKVPLKVLDTKAPSILGPDTLHIPIHTSIQQCDFSKYYQIKDLSELSIHYDTKDIQSEVSGQYKMTIYAKDCYKNESIKEVSVFIDSSSYINHPIQSSSKETRQISSKHENVISPNTNSKDDDCKETSTPENPVIQEPKSNKDEKPEYYFWAKCKTCDMYYESSKSLDEVISYMESHLDQHHECAGYTYGKSLR